MLAVPPASRAADRKGERRDRYAKACSWHLASCRGAGDDARHGPTKRSESNHDPLRHLLRRDILAIDSGREIGKPDDVLVDPKKHQVALVVLADGNIPETAVVFPASAVEIFDTDAIALDSMSSLRLAVHDEDLLEEMEHGIRLRHRTAFPRGGEDRTIVGVEVDAKGQVTNYWLRRPRFGLFRPRFALKPAQIDRLGADVVVTKAKIRLP